MFIKSRKLILVLIAIMVMGLFAGCSTSEQAVFGGVIKSFDILSYEDTTDMTVNVKVSGLPEEDMAAITPVIDIISGSKLTINQKVVANADKTDVKGQFNCLIDANGTTMNYDLWLKSGIENGKYSFNEIIKIPALMRAVLPDRYAGKEYLVMNSDYMEALGQMNSAELMKSFAALQTEFKKSLVEFAKDYAFNKEVVKYIGQETVNGESVKVYEMTFNDQLFKEWIHYLVNSGIKNDAMISFLNSYLTIIEGFSVPTAENKEVIDEIKSLKDEIGTQMTEEQKTELIALVDKFFEDTKDIPVIGDGGLIVDLKINQDGWIVASKGNLNIVIDCPKWNEKYSEDSSMETLPVINLNIGFNENMTNINQDIKIEFPEVNYQNSVDIADLEKKAEPIKVYLNEQRIYFDVDPILQNGRTLVPVRRITEAMDMDVAFNAAAKTVTVKKDGTTIVLKINNKTAYVNGQAVTMDVPAKIINGRTLIPLKFISENLKAEVTWDQNTKSVLIKTN